MEWKNILTNKQKGQIIRVADKQLRLLVACPEARDLLEDFMLSNKSNGRGTDQLFLTKNGLIEERFFYDGKTRGEAIIKKKDFGKIIEKYKLEPEAIQKIKMRLTTTRLTT